MNNWTKIKKNSKSLGEPPTEASDNLKSPELAPRDKRFNGRSKRIGFTCHPDFYETLRNLAHEERCKQIEILEKALDLYLQKKK